MPGQSELQEVSWPKFLELAEMSRERAASAAWYVATVALSESSRPREVVAARVSERSFEIWGAQPLTGRLLASQLFGAVDASALHLAAATSLMALVAGLGALVPGRRAAAVDPATAPFGEIRTLSRSQLRHHDPDPE